MAELEPKNDQTFWSIAFTLFFVVLFFIQAAILYRVNGVLPTSISLFDFTLIILAAFRFTRLFVYDKIMAFFRDWFMDEIRIINSEGEVFTSREKPSGGPRRTMAELLDCPWCTGLWFGFFTAFFYFLTPLAWYAILGLAVAGLASLAQIMANLIGWRAEFYKKEANRDRIDRRDPF